MNEFELCFELPWLLLLFPLLAFVIGHAYRYTYRGERRLRESPLPLLCRLVALLCVTLLLSGFSVVTNRAGVSVMIAADVSDSMRSQRSRLAQDVNQLLEALPEGERVGVVSFARDVQEEKPLAAERGAVTLHVPDNAAVTDISAVLSDALTRMDANTRRRVILLTDGRETDGDVLTAAHLLAGKGVRVDAVRYATGVTTAEAEVTDIRLPADVSLGTVCKVVVTVESNDSIRATLALYDEDVEVKQAAVRLKKGKNTFNYTVNLTTPGMRVFTARLTPDQDTIAENNTMSACVNVSVSTTALIIDGTGEDGQGLCDLMNQSGHHAILTDPAGFPRNMAEMCRYGMMILMNVNEQDLRAEAADLLEEYIRVYGRSVLVTGGENAFVYGNYLNTAFEEFLPVEVNVQERESAESTALVLVLDCSASMGITMTRLHTATLNPLEMAKRGAIKCAARLNSNDHVAVISFSDKTYVMREMTSAVHQEEIVAAISRMATMGGTMYCDALRAALDEMSKVPDVANRHIIFLSDGNAGDDQYESIVEEIKEQGISLTTIAVGDDIDASILQRLAEMGGGRYYRAEDPYDLPSVMLSDTVLQQVDCIVEGCFVPRVGYGSTLFDASAALPPLTGYVRTETKNEAELVLCTDSRQPLYAVWRYGAGLCGAFTSDVGGHWSEEWMSTEAGRNACLQIVSALMPESSSVNTYGAQIISGGVEGKLRITCLDSSVQRGLTAEVIAPDGSVQRVALTFVQDGSYEQTIALHGMGKYTIRLYPTLPDGTEEDVVETAAAVSLSREYEAFPDNGDQATLERICAITGGVVVRSPSALGDVDMSQAYIEYDPSVMLATAALISLMLELLLRRFKRLRLPRLRRK